MARRKQKSAFLCAVQELPETTGDILRNVWGGLVAIGHRIWRPVAARPILWFLMIYFGLIAVAIGWRYAEGNSGGFGILNWAFWEKPSGQSESGAALNGTEGIRNLVWSLATLVGGAAAGIGLILAARRTKAANDQAEAALQQSETAFQSLVTERFTRAVEQLGHEQRAVRLGAIYALERIATDSPRDRDTILETLAAYIRELAPWPPLDEKGKPLDDAALEAEKARTGVRPSIDIAAALTVICRLLPDGDAMRGITDLRHTDLRGLDAPGINLSQMRLDEANMSEATLNGANLTQTKMSGTNLGRTLMSMVKLQGALLDRADLGGVNMLWGNLLNASLIKVDLSHAVLLDTKLDNASLSEADLSSTQLHASYFSNTDLSGVRNLTQEQIDSIQYRRGYPPRNLPPGLTLPEPCDL